MAKRKSFVGRNLPKYLLQWTSLAALLVFLTGLIKLVFPESPKPDPEALCPMGGLEAFGTYLVRGRFKKAEGSSELFANRLIYECDDEMAAFYKEKSTQVRRRGRGRRRVGTKKR